MKPESTRRHEKESAKEKHIAGYPNIRNRRRCRVTYLNPAFLLCIKGVIFSLGTIDSNSLARRSDIISTADGRPLPILHLCECGWTRRRRGGERHQKSRGAEQKVGRDAKEERRVGRESALKPSPVANQDVRAFIKRWRGEACCDDGTFPSGQELKFRS